MYRTLISESEKNRILSLHKKEGYKTLLQEKVQWRQNNVAPYKFLDTGENIKSLQKALGFPERLQTGNFYTKTEVAVKNKMKELSLGEYSRNNGITQEIFDKIIAKPDATLTTPELQQLQNTANNSQTTSVTDSQSVDDSIVSTEMKIEISYVAPKNCAFTLSYDNPMGNKRYLSKPYNLILSITDPQNVTYKLKENLEFQNQSTYQNYYFQTDQLEPQLDSFDPNVTYKLLIQFEGGKSIETDFKVTNNWQEETEVNKDETKKGETTGGENKTETVPVIPGF